MTDRIEIVHDSYMWHIFSKVSYAGKMRSDQKRSAIKEWIEFSDLIEKNLQNITETDKND